MDKYHSWLLQQRGDVLRCRSPVLSMRSSNLESGVSLRHQASWLGKGATPASVFWCSRLPDIAYGSCARIWKHCPRRVHATAPLTALRATWELAATSEKKIKEGPPRRPCCGEYYQPRMEIWGGHATRRPLRITTPVLQFSAACWVVSTQVLHLTIFRDLGHRPRDALVGYVSS